jgi:FtsP/CotA-like multicopper oxidase with cupredoxin domain
VVGEEGIWVKMFDPPNESPPTPELLAPTNPVPAFVAATVPGATMTIPNTLDLRLMNGTDLTMWDGRRISMFTISDRNIPAASGGTFPAVTLRVPRGVIFHAETQGAGPPPHTIHWHGIEPTPINDGVGHCSMEIGRYTYQWQPNFIGSYFYHCHRNTVQHFDFGLYGFLIIEPPDAYDAANPNRGGYPRRTAANLTNFPQFPGFNSSALESGDPHAFTVPYDVEALWVLDDIDSAWHDLASNARAFFPAHGPNPGVDDFFPQLGIFHDFNPDYFVCTGVNFPGPLGSTANLPANIVVPRDLNSGVAGMQVSVNAQTDQTVLVRILNGAYTLINVTFPVDVVIIAFDGRALGVPPFNRYNAPFVLKAGVPFELSTARRFDALIRSATPVDSFANIEYRHNFDGRFLFNGRIPIRIS